MYYVLIHKTLELKEGALSFSYVYHASDINFNIFVYLVKRYKRLEEIDNRHRFNDYLANKEEHQAAKEANMSPRRQ